MYNQLRLENIWKLYQTVGYLQGVLKGVVESGDLTSDVKKAVISALDKSEEMLK